MNILPQQTLVGCSMSKGQSFAGYETAVRWQFTNLEEEVDDMDLALQGFVLPLSTRIAVMEGEAGRASEEYGGYAPETGGEIRTTYMAPNHKHQHNCVIDHRISLV
jgi:hypothetical protein